MSDASQLIEGLQLVSRALRNGQWEISRKLGLTPTQGSILNLISSHSPQGMRVKAISAELGVAQPTATESINSLITKGLLKKNDDPQDGRASLLLLTPAARKLVGNGPTQIPEVEGALASLGHANRADLLKLIVSTIRALQNSGAIAPQRLCVTCKYFRGNAHADKSKPHHCQFVNAAFGNADLRVNCGDHETADPAYQAATWKAFDGKAETLRANQT